MIKLGVVGCGYWGPKHIRVCHELTSAKLTSVCDLDERKLKQVRAQYPDVETAVNYRRFLQNGVDAVLIATPVNSHFRLAKEALLANKHVLLEKPIPSTSGEAAELIELAEKRGLVLMVGHTYEYHPAVEYLKKIIKNGDLGEIYSIDSARLNLGLFRPDVKVLWDLAPHDLSIMNTLLDDEPIAVSAQGTLHAGPNTYDIAYLEV